MPGKQLDGVGNTISKKTSNKLELVLDGLITNAITVNTKIICSNAELECNNITATGEVHVANAFVNCAELILPLAVPTIMPVREGSCYYNDTIGNLLISKDGQTFQTPTLQCVTAQPATVGPASTLCFDTANNILFITNGTHWSGVELVVPPP